MPHPPRLRPVYNSNVIGLSRLYFTQNVITCDLILSFVEVEHIAIVA